MICVDVGQQINALPVSIIGRFLYHCIPFRRHVILSNINQVYGSSLTKRQKTHLVQSFYSHLATSFKEFLLLRFMGEKQLRARVDVRGHQHMLDVVADGKGVLVLTGHFGNWEFAPLGGSLNFKQFHGQFHFIRRMIDNKVIERIVFSRYHRAGLNVIPKKDSLQQVSDALDKNHAVVFVLDQHASVLNHDGVAVEFFGKKAGTYRSLAIFSRHTSVPVVPAAGYRLPNGRHVLEFFEPIVWQDYGTAQESIYRNTLAYNQALEKIILAHPEQWFWFHKRWKLEI